MFNFLEFEDRILINPIRKTRIKIKEPKVLPKVMTLAEILKIMKCAYRKFDLMSSNKSHPYFESLRDVVILELLFSTGGRVSEIAELNEKQIDLKTGNLVLKGKGDKERVIQICSQETLNILKTYVEIAAEKIKKANGAFLINRFGKQLSDQSIRNMVRKFSVKAKINRNITPHVFRHTFATLLLEKDVDIKYIQSLLGHSSIMTTQLYTHVNRRKQRKILTTKHPRMGISFRSVSSPE